MHIGAICTRSCFSPALPYPTPFVIPHASSVILDPRLLTSRTGSNRVSRVFVFCMCSRRYITVIVTNGLRIIK